MNTCDENEDCIIVLLLYTRLRRFSDFKYFIIVLIVCRPTSSVIRCVYCRCITIIILPIAKVSGAIGDMVLPHSDCIDEFSM